MVALNDEEVRRQIEQMVAFIQQEANEKVQEIEAKAEEEFNIEKGRLVQQERLRIMNLYEKKEKQLSLSIKIMHSQCLNKSRLELLKGQDDAIHELLQLARERLSSISQNQEKYKEILRKLIIQGLFQLLENNVTIIGRQQDKSLITSLIPECIKEYHEKGLKNELKLTVEEKSFLFKDCSGGVELVTPDGRIRVNNTLDKRLEIISHQIMPKIRETLFGVNANRKFRQ